MLMLIQKASDDMWYEIRDVATLSDLLSINDSTIIEPNFWQGVSFKEFSNCSFFAEKDYNTISQITHRALIYDDYIE